MSVEAVKWAMDDAPMLLTEKGKPDSTSRHVLQALAEHAHRDGGSANPSVLRLQYRTGYDRRTVQRALRRLEDAKLIVADGSVGGRTQYRLQLSLVRPESDWAALELEEEQLRDAAAARQRRSRAKRVTAPESVTVTHSKDVTEKPVTHSASVSHALEQRDVTHSDDARHALSAALTIKEPPTEPSENQLLPGLSENLPAIRATAAEVDSRPDWLAQLQAAMSASGIDVPWKFVGTEQLLLQNDVQRLGIPRMVRFAVDAKASASRPPFSSRWFYPGWRQIPTPADPNVIPLQQAKSRQQQETDDWFARAMARAEERDRQENNS